MRTSKTIKRLGLGAGIATVVGTMSLAWMPAAFASTVTSPTLSLSSTASGVSGVTATNDFTATTATSAAPTITVTSDNTTTGTTSGPSVDLSYTQGDYTVTVNGTNNPVTKISCTTAPCTTQTITLTNAIPAGAAVVVTIANNTNPQVTSSTGVYFTDATSADTTPANTNTVQIAPATATTPTVTDVEPHALPLTASPFTVYGSSFFGTTTSDTPLVCFIVAGSTPGTATSAACPASTGTGGAAAIPATSLTSVSADEIQGTATLTAGTWDTVVYNYNPAANSGLGGYTTASATSSADQVRAISGLDVIPESGVRIADSRSGDNLPKGPIASGATVAIPITDFNNSSTQPDNLPTLQSPTVAGEPTGLSMNVTAVAPAGVGNLQVFPSSTGTCTASTNTMPSNTNPATVNFQPPQDTSNDAIIPIPTGTQDVCITDNGASVNVVMDLTGYTIGSAYTGTGTTDRLIDTRSGYSAVSGGGLLGPLAGGTVYSVTFPPADDSTTVALNVAAVDPTKVGNLRVFPASGSPASCPTSASGVPNTAVLNYIPGIDASSFYIITVPSDGTMCLYSDTAGTVNVVIDQYGTVGSSHVHALSEPFRVYDSRPGGLASGSFAVVKASPSGSGSDFIPTGAAAVIGSLSDIDPTAVGNLRTYPDGTPVPNAATMPNYPNQIRENLALVALNPQNGAFDVYSDGATTNFTFDATAYIS